MAEKRDNTTEIILEPGVYGHHRRKKKVLEFAHSSTQATMMMVAAAFLALVIANIPAWTSFHNVWEITYLGFSIGDFTAEISLGHFINDFFMALFFLLVGLEIKMEMTAGELRNPRKAILPIVGAIGGGVLPAAIYFAFNVSSGTVQGWGVPMANDIAFCLGILALLGSRVPPGLRAFLSTLTIADDIVAILVIAVFYTANLSIPWLAGGLALFALLIVINRRHVYDLVWYVIIGLAMWVCFLLSGVHATIAGVLLALTISAQSEIRLDKVNAWFSRKAASAEGRYDPGEPDVKQKEYLEEIDQIRRVSCYTIPPLTRLEHRLHPYVYFLILPLFAFANAGVTVIGTDPLDIVTSPVALGVFFGLLIGKPVGVSLFTWLVVKFRLSELPSGVRWGHIFSVSVLSGVGFTMAIFIANLAYPDSATVDLAKIAILSASLIAGVAGFLVLRWQVSKDEPPEPDDVDIVDDVDPPELAGIDILVTDPK